MERVHHLRRSGEGRRPRPVRGLLCKYRVVWVVWRAEVWLAAAGRRSLPPWQLRPLREASRPGPRSVAAPASLRGLHTSHNPHRTEPVSCSCQPCVRRRGACGRRAAQEAKGRARGWKLSLPGRGATQRNAPADALGANSSLRVDHDCHEGTRWGEHAAQYSSSVQYEVGRARSSVQ
jgi:hypothetical protein